MSFFGKLPLEFLGLVFFFFTKEVHPSEKNVIFVGNDTSKFTRLILDETRRDLFIGAVDKIYQISFDLQLRAKHCTGAINPSIHNYNKFLIKVDGALISCGNVSRETCMKHDIMNISNATTILSEPFIATDAIAFIATDATDIMPQTLGYPQTESSSFSRSLSIENGQKIGAFILLDPFHQNNYTVRYIYGFSSGKSTYFIAVHMNPSSMTSSLASKLIKIHRESKDDFTYEDIPFECYSKDGQHYDIAQAAHYYNFSSKVASSLGFTSSEILFVTFTQNEPLGFGNFENTSKYSALCMFSLKDINDEFANNSILPSKVKCVSIQDAFQTNESFCGIRQNWSTIPEAALPFSTIPTIIFNITLTAVTSVVIQDSVGVFIGTETGHLKKILVKNRTHAFPFDEIAIDEGFPVHSDILMDRLKRDLFIMTRNKLTRMKMLDCGEWNTHQNCMKTKNPFCGWCNLNKCALKDDCVSLHSWGSCNKGTCAVLKDITPKVHSLDSDEALKLEFHVEGFPIVKSDSLFCAFNFDEELLVKASPVNTSIVTCPMPDLSSLSSVSPRLNISAKLSIKASDGLKLFETNYTFFNCCTYANCVSCVSSTFPCHWSMSNHPHCVGKIPSGSKNSTALYIENLNTSHAIRPESTRCPMIKASAENTKMLVSNGTVRNITVNILNVNVFKKPKFFCQFIIRGKAEKENAILTNDTITCGAHKFHHIFRELHVTVSLSVLWNYSLSLDNPDNMNLTIYTCSLMATDSDKCLSLHEKYGCGWCHRKNKPTCEIKSQCDDNLGEWIYPNDPSFSFGPPLGPYEGGTNIKILGRNMKEIFNDMNCSVTIASKPCKILQKIIHNQEIVCKTSNTGIPAKESFPVVIKGANLTVMSFENFTFANPKINNISFESVNRNLINGSRLLIIIGNYMNAGQTVEVLVDDLPCIVIKTSPQTIHCTMNSSNELRDFVVVVKFDGNTRLYQQRTTLLNNPSTSSKHVFIYVGIAILVVILSLIIFYMFYRRKVKSVKTKASNKIQEQIIELESQVALECKEAFTELQTEMNDFESDPSTAHIPFLEFHSCIVKILFPYSEHSNLLGDNVESVGSKKGLELFNQLILDKRFLLLFVQTLENDENFSMNDRAHVSALILLSLQNQIEYCTEIVTTLLAEYIGKCIKTKRNLKLLLRVSDSIVEKMLSGWLTFLLYKFLGDRVGKSLYMLFKAITQQVNKGPVDVITSEAKYSLSQAKLLRQLVKYNPITINIRLSEQISHATELKSVMVKFPVKVLDCDAISQVKQKIINRFDVICRNINYNQRLQLLELYMQRESTGEILLDEDSNSKIEDDWRKKNTLAYYGILDGETLILISAGSESTNTLKKFSNKMEKSRNSRKLKQQPSNSSSRWNLMENTEVKYQEWHLVKPSDLNNNDQNTDTKLISEIYLTRLLATKCALQKFIDDLFEAIFSTDYSHGTFPTVIKYLFDFLDDQASKHGVVDPAVVHMWKNNSLRLRFWVNLIKNPDFLFDVNKSNTVDSCLGVVAQAFMDSCSTSEHHITKDSPCSKLLYAKDIPRYKQLVERYYLFVKSMPPISGGMNAMYKEHSYSTKFDENFVLYELYGYAVKYRDPLMITLKKDKISQTHKLSHQLQQVYDVMQADTGCLIDLSSIS